MSSSLRNGGTAMVSEVGTRNASPSGWRLRVTAVGMYLLIRLLMVPAFLFAWGRQGPNLSSYTTASPNLLSFLAVSWDGSWYQRIAMSGYPSALPTDPVSGAVEQNAWAFYPMFPAVVKAVMTVTNLSFLVASPLVAFIMGAAAVALVATLVSEAAPEALRHRPNLPLLTVAALSAFPSAAVCMVGYSETTALFIIALSLLLISRRQYAWAALAIIALGFTRAVALPMVAVVVWHGVLRWRATRSAGTPTDRVMVVKLVALSLVAAISGVIWPLITGVVTGVPDAYFRTQAAWRLGRKGDVPFTLFAEKLSEWVGPWGLLITLAACLSVTLLTFTPPARRLGAELQSWGAAYLVYIVAVADLGSSILRLGWLSITLPMVIVALPKKGWLQVMTIMALLVSQTVWIIWIWVYGGRGDPFPP